MIQIQAVAPLINPFQVVKAISPATRKQLLEGTNIALKALPNLIKLADITSLSAVVPHLKDIRKGVNCLQGLQNVLVGTMAKELFWGNLAGNAQQKARWFGMLNSATHFVIDSIHLTSKYSMIEHGLIAQSMGVVSIMRESQEGIAALYGDLKQAKVIWGFLGAVEGVEDTLSARKRDRVGQAALKLVKAGVDVGALIAGSSNEPQWKAALTVISAGLSAYKLYNDSQRRKDQ